MTESVLCFTQNKVFCVPVNFSNLTFTIVKRPSFQSRDSVARLLLLSLGRDHLPVSRAFVCLRGESLLQFIIANDSHIVNKENCPTFVTSRREEVLDKTVATT